MWRSPDDGTERCDRFGGQRGHEMRRDLAHAARNIAARSMARSPGRG